MSLAKIEKVSCALLVMVLYAYSQNVTSFNTQNTPGLFDPSRLTINHSISLGMSSSSGSSGLKSQSLYSTMLTYQFSLPVTMHLNFGLPIYSSYSQAMNPTQKNLQSLDYFKNMPFEGSLVWKPKDNLAVIVSVAKETYNPEEPYSMFAPYHFFPLHD